MDIELDVNRRLMDRNNSQIQPLVNNQSKFKALLINSWHSRDSVTTWHFRINRAFVSFSAQSSTKGYEMFAKYSWRGASKHFFCLSLSCDANNKNINNSLKESANNLWNALSAINSIEFIANCWALVTILVEELWSTGKGGGDTNIWHALNSLHYLLALGNIVVSDAN